MSLTYQFNELTNNIENKILLKNLYVKFFIRNKLDKITFIIENEFKCRLKLLRRKGRRITMLLWSF